ncbi:MAG: type II/IV secretion system protein [Rhodocyclaceae bacterium]|nr:type II/IV secretion system protein [Rhodocyclaceae bacterium]MBX3670493.1 type II/IV secretion system protein [Rhodocyclaceae bacterium]
MARPQKIRLGEMLLGQNLISESQLQTALEEQKRSGRKLGRVFIDGGLISEEGLARALARQLQLDFVDLRHARLRRELVERLPEAQARRFRALVLEVDGIGLTVGMADPTDLFAYDELARILKAEIHTVVVLESELLAAIDRLYRRTDEISGLAAELGNELGDLPGDFGALLGTGSTIEEAPVVKLLQTLFEDAVRARASDIHFEPQAARLTIRFRIDGVLHVQTETDLRIAPALVLRLKLMSGLDISEKRLPQDGRFEVKVPGQVLDMRISTLPTQFGESVVLRLLSHSKDLLDLDRLGMPPRLYAQLKSAIRHPAGMILVTGPTGSGKTTTLYATLAALNSPDRKIITVEDPVEYRLPGINQVQVHEKIELSFGRVLRAALRQDPDVILVGEMRDRETAEIGLRAAMTGHLVLSTLHTNDAASTPMRLLDMGVARYMVATALHLVIAQRLVRTLCAHCTRPHALAPGEHEWLRVELGAAVDQHEYHRGAGCPQCNGTGYLGRTAVYEALEMTRNVVEAANDEDPAAFVRAAREQMAGHSLRRDALRLVLEGRSSVEEAMRVASQQD